MDRISSKLAKLGYRVHDPDLTYAMPDHAIASVPGRTTDTNPTGGRLLRELRRGASACGYQTVRYRRRRPGIVHVAAPELGLTLPGATVVCPDSHTCTHGALGALAIAIGSSEVAHVLATQTLRQKKPKTMRIRLEGARAPGRFGERRHSLHDRTARHRRRARACAGICRALSSSA